VRRWPARWPDLLWSLGIAVVVLGPMLIRRGYVLRGDMVFVPRMPWKDAWLGLDGSVGRAVPVDALVSVATSVVPGDLLQKAILLAAFVIGGWSVSGLVADAPVVARLGAVTIYLWNPWVLERLALGQWGFVLGYAFLPLVVRAAFVLRDDVRRGWAPTVLWLGASAICTPSSGLMAALTATVIVLTRPKLVSVLVVLGASLAVNLAWLAPSLLSPPASGATGGQFAAFGARAESAAGVVLSVLSLGGVWKESIVPRERTDALVVALSVVLTAIALAGLWRARARGSGDLVRGLGIVAAISVLLALVPTWGPTRSFFERGAETFAALGILRDSQRYLAPAALLLAVGLALAIEGVWLAAAAPRQSLKAVAVLLLLWPVLVLPSLSWGISGYYDPVDYPAEWGQVSKRLESLPSGTTVVLPWLGGYRGFPWNDRHASLDPAPRFFPGEVLIDDRLLFRDRVLGSEDTKLRRVGAALEAADPGEALAAIGVSYVLVEKANGLGRDDVPAGDVLHDGTGLTLIRLDGGTAGTTGGGGLDEAPRPWRPGVLAADILVVLLLVVAMASTAARRVYSVRHIGERHREGV